MTESDAKKFFIDLMSDYRDKKLTADEVSKKIDEYLHEYIYTNEIEITEPGLLSAMELARELNEAEEGSVDYEEGIRKPLNDYLSENASDS